MVVRGQRRKWGLMLYQTYQAHADLMWLPRTFARLSAPALHLANAGPLSVPGMRGIAAANELFTLAKLSHRRPAFGIDTVTVDGRRVEVVEEVVCRCAFGNLLRFRKPDVAGQPRVLLVAPMSGHFATLLRETVRTMLPEHDVYITDWHNARDVSLDNGRFGFDEYVDYLMAFLGAMGEGVHVVSICQPCVPALAATALLAEEGAATTPRSLTLMAGPVDCRANPTGVNELATTRPIDWFERHMIARVPWRYRGARRRVYPGFLQIGAFLNMNLDRHVNAFRALFDDLVAGEAEGAEAKRDFYEEYLAVADLPAEFYLETVQRVFQDYALPRGQLYWHGRRVKPEAIRETALLTVEGERDDICAPGQTEAAQALCPNVPAALRRHHVQSGVGHFGIFNGRRWAGMVYPLVREMVARTD